MITISPARSLGATGLRVPLLGYGTHPLGLESVSREQAVHCLNHAIDRGITFIDTSPDYGSEPHVGEVMRARRDEVFLATKINRRSKDGVLAEIKESLDRLQTDHIDLIQVHAVNAWADLQQTLAAGGALEGLEQARDEGLVRFIGITGHARPELLAHALTRYPFDTVLVALGAADRLVTAPETFLLPAAVQTGTGVIAMKVLMHGHINNPAAGFRYSLGLPGVSLAIVGMSSTEQIDEMVAIAASFEPLDDRETAELLEETRSLVEEDARQSEQGWSNLFWLHDTKVMGWCYEDEPAGVAY
jgi:uncharacterized protein